MTCHMKLWPSQAGEEVHYKGTLDAWSKIYHEEGPKAFFKVPSCPPPPHTRDEHHSR